MNCYKCNTGGYSPEELVRHQVDSHGYPEPVVTPMRIITTRDEVDRRIAKAVTERDEVWVPCMIRLKYLLDAGLLDHLTIELRELIEQDIAAAIRVRGEKS